MACCQVLMIIGALKMLNNTQKAIRKMAWHTAQHSDHKDKHIRQRAKDAQEHCRKLGVDWTKPLTA